MVQSTKVTLLLDRSGSMGICHDTTIEAFNSYLAELKTAPEGIDFTFLQFDSVSLDKCCVVTPISDVPLLSRETYVPRGNTPLIDAAYKTIKAVEAAVADHDKIVICIQTDGEENASVEYSWEALNTLVQEKIALGWQFNFMGAGINAYCQGAKMGISAMGTMSYNHLDAGATREAFAASARNTRLYASGQRVNSYYSMADRRAAQDSYVDSAITGDGVPMQVLTSVVQAQIFDLKTRMAPTSTAKPNDKKVVPDIKL